MVKARRTVRLWCVVTALALTALFVPAVAFGSLTTGQSSVGTQASKGFVADRVYAIIGNDYAMTVSETASTRTVDIIDANYNKTVELVDTVNAGDDWYSFTPKTTYGYDALFAHGVKVKAKNSGLYGVVGFDGKMLIPAQYVSLGDNGTYMIAASVSTQGVGNISILSSSTGKTITTTSVGRADDEFDAYPGSHDGEVDYYCYGKDGTYSSGTYRFTGSGLVKVDSVKVDSASEDSIIAEGIVQHWEWEAEDRDSPRYLDKSGNVIESLVGWSYHSRTTNGYLFVSKDWSRAKIVDAHANVLVELPDAALDGNDASLYDVIGSPEHVVFTLADGRMALYSTSGAYEKTIASSSGQYLLGRLNGYLLVWQWGTGKDSFGRTKRDIRILDIYDSSLNEVGGAKPALGRVQGTVNGTTLYGSGLDASGLFYDPSSPYEPNMLTAAGEPFKVGAYTLVRPVRGEYYNVSVSDISDSSKNAYVAKSSSGKYGLTTTAGKAVVPFSYDDIFAGSSNASGIAKSDYVMVKKDGAWQFYDVKAGAPKTTKADSVNTVKADSLKIVAAKTATVSGGVYKVLNESARTVAYQKPAKSAATVKIPATVKIDGKSYKVTSIAANAFKNDKKLKKLTVGTNVATIGKSAFQGCTKLTTVALGKNVKTVGASAFAGCQKLAKVTIMPKVTTIGKAAFKNCKALKAVVVGKGTKSIGASAFEGCKKMTKLTFKTNKLTAKKVGAKAFKGTPATLKVKCGSKAKAYAKWLYKKGISKKATVGK